LGWEGILSGGRGKDGGWSNSLKSKVGVLQCEVSSTSTDLRHQTQPTLFLNCAYELRGTQHC